jgi:hypothetical protein
MREGGFLEAQIKRLILVIRIQKPDRDHRRLSGESEVKENGAPGKGNVHGMLPVRLYGLRKV